MLLALVLGVILILLFAFNIFQLKGIYLMEISKKLRLMFSGGGGAGTEALFRLLGSRYEVFFADADPDVRPHSVPEDRWYQIPMASSLDFNDMVIDTCRRLRIDVLIPTVDEELLPLSLVQDQLACNLLLPPERFVVRHLDKLTSNQFLHSFGLPAPQTILAGQGYLDFPCVVKPRSGRGSRHVAKVYSEAELHAQITLSRKDSKDFIIQELIDGQEYTVMMAADKNGCLRAVVPVLVGCKRGITLRAHTLHDQEVIDACRAIHEVDPVSGCYNIQLIKTLDGFVKPFEINPRISTTACLGLAAGIDFIKIYLEPSGSCHELSEFTNELKLKRSWYNEIWVPNPSELT